MVFTTRNRAPPRQERDKSAQRQVKSVDKVSGGTPAMERKTTSGPGASPSQLRSCTPPSLIRNSIMSGLLNLPGTEYATYQPNGVSASSTLVADGMPPRTEASKSSSAALPLPAAARHAGANRSFVDDVLTQFGFTLPGHAWMRL